MLSITHGAVRAVIDAERGGRLAQLDLGSGPVLRAYDASLPWADWGCFPLVPWSNRIPGGRLHYGDIDERLAVNWPDGSAIHGLAAQHRWTVETHSPDRAELSIAVRQSPYAIDAFSDFRVYDDGLHWTLRVRNNAPHPVPAGIGIHPWFHAGALRVPADARWPGSPLPSGPPTPVTAADDLRQPREPPPMDACFTSLSANSLDVPGVRLSWIGPVTHVVVYSEQPGWLAVEPVTMVNNGFALADGGVDGTGVVALATDDALEVTYSFAPACHP